MRTSILSGAILVAATVGAYAQSGEPVGEWLVEDGTARIKVVSCPQAQGQAPALWGVIWAESQPGTDSKNPDPSMKNRPLLGVPILIGMRQTQPNRWEGKIYDATRGSLFDSNISVNRNDTLAVRGCVAGIFCGGQDWKRVTGTNTPPLPQASASQPKGAMAQSQPGRGVTTGRAASAPAADPICSSVAGLVPRI